MAMTTDWWRGKKIVDAAQKAAVYILLCAGLIMVLFPMAWLVSASLKPNSEIFSYPPIWLRWPPLVSNYPRALEVLEFAKGLRNTLLVAVPSVIGQMISCSLVGYGLARIKFPHRDAIFALVLATMMLPSQVTLIPTFVIFSRLKLVDTFWPFWLPAWTATSGFNIFLFRQFFLTIPPELEDAARIDGAGGFDIYRRIMLPLSGPVLTAVALFSFLSYWNDFFGPLIYLQSAANKTLQLQLMNFQQIYSFDWGPMMAAEVVILLPPILIFFFAQRMFIQGVVFTGIKE